MSLRFTDVHAALPGDRVVHVTILWGNVEIAEYDERASQLVQFDEPATQRFEPAQLVRVLVGAGLLSVGHV